MKKFWEDVSPIDPERVLTDDELAAIERTAGKTARVPCPLCREDGLHVRLLLAEVRRLRRRG
jgi:hypothetical protein